MMRVMLYEAAHGRLEKRTFSRPSTPVPLPTRPWCNGAGIPQCFALHAFRTHRSLICVGCTRPRPQGDYISIANGGNETNQKRDGQQETDMSADNTSQPSIKYCVDNVSARYIHGRPEPELVPSRYALKVGAIDVLVVSDGVL